MLLNFVMQSVRGAFKGNYRERNYAEMFVDIDNTSPITKMPSSGKELYLRYSKVLLRF
jgi:hypothetical protein